MARLVFFVARSGVIDVREAIEGELAIAFKSFRSRAAVDFLVGFVARVRPHGIKQTAPAGTLLESGVDKAAAPSMLERRMEIPHMPSFFVDVAVVDLMG